MFHNVAYVRTVKKEKSRIMGLKIIKQGESIRPSWYAQYRSGDKWRTINLRVKIHGTPPASLSLADSGDEVFERSRAKATEKLREFVEQLKKYESDGGSMPALLKDAELKRSSRLSLVDLPSNEEIRLRQLFDHDASERDKQHLNEKIYLRKLVYSRFADFAAARKPAVTNLRQLTTAVINDYFTDLKAHYSRAVVAKHLHLIESAWKRYTPTGLKSPFGDTPDLLKKLAKDNPAIPRRPLTKAEVTAVWNTAQELDAATDSPLKLRPLAITAACTGMRIGDCCNLKWSDVKLDATPIPLITVKTAKTGSNVTIPIFDELLAILTDLDTRRDCRDVYVFPAAHKQYTSNPDNLFKRGKRLFARAIFLGHDEPEEIAAKPSKTPQEIISLIRRSNTTDKRKERLEGIYTRYVIGGESYKKIATAYGITKGQVSEVLHSIEKLTDSKIRIGGNTIGGIGLSGLVEKTRQAHAKAGKQSSIYGWHSLRASFVVFAFSKGIQEEIVAKIVGHSTVQTTRNYFNPTEKNAADIFAHYMGGSLLAQNAPQALVNAPGSLPAPDAANDTPATPDAPQTAPAANLDALKAQLAALPPEQRQSLLAALK